MKRSLLIVTLVMSFVFAIGLAGCGPKSNASDSQNQSGEAASEASPSDENNGNADAGQDSTTYAQDTVVNDFVVAYNAISSSPFEELEKGNIRTKYYGNSYGYYIELLHSDNTGKICVTIDETNDNAEIGTAGMHDVFNDVVRTIDPTLTADAITKFFNTAISGQISSLGTETLGNIEVAPLGEHVKVSYSPDTGLSSGHSRGHFDIYAV